MTLRARISPFHERHKQDRFEVAVAMQDLTPLALDEQRALLRTVEPDRLAGNLDLEWAE
jgi:hypothetical protein